MVNIGTKIAERVASAMKELGVEMDENVFVQNISMTDVPKDDFQTKIILQRALYEGVDEEEDYYCFVCGEKFDDPNEFLTHYQGHLDSFMANVPIYKNPNLIDKIVESMPPDQREATREALERHNKEAKKAEEAINQE